MARSGQIHIATSGGSDSPKHPSPSDRALRCKLIARFVPRR
jgi:hypothetical protein